MKGHVYILTNDYMPGLVKIGRTTGDPELRAQQLYQTGVPFPFAVFYSVLSPDCAELENILHEAMPDFRINDGREFFKCAPDFAKSLLDEYHMEQLHRWVDEFAGDKLIVDPDLHCDEGAIEELAHSLGEPAPIVTAAVGFLTEEEIRPAIIRLYEKMARREGAEVVR